MHKAISFTTVDMCLKLIKIYANELQQSRKGRVCKNICTRNWSTTFFTFESVIRPLL